MANGLGSLRGLQNLGEVFEGGIENVGPLDLVGAISKTRQQAMQDEKLLSQIRATNLNAQIAGQKFLQDKEEFKLRKAKFEQEQEEFEGGAEKRKLELEEVGLDVEAKKREKEDELLKDVSSAMGNVLGSIPNFSSLSAEEQRGLQEKTLDKLGVKGPAARQQIIDLNDKKRRERMRERSELESKRLANETAQLELRKEQVKRASSKLSEFSSADQIRSALTRKGALNETEVSVLQDYQNMFNDPEFKNMGQFYKFLDSVNENNLLEVLRKQNEDFYAIESNSEFQELKSIATGKKEPEEPLSPKDALTVSMIERMIGFNLDPNDPTSFMDMRKDLERKENEIAENAKKNFLDGVHPQMIGIDNANLSRVMNLAEKGEADAFDLMRISANALNTANEVIESSARSAAKLKTRRTGDLGDLFVTEEVEDDKILIDADNLPPEFAEMVNEDSVRDLTRAEGENIMITPAGVRKIADLIVQKNRLEILSLVEKDRQEDPEPKSIEDGVTKAKEQVLNKERGKEPIEQSALKKSIFKVNLSGAEIGITQGDPEELESEVDGAVDDLGGQDFDDLSLPVDEPATEEVQEATEEPTEVSLLQPNLLPGLANIRLV